MGANFMIAHAISWSNIESIQLAAQAPPVALNWIRATGQELIHARLKSFRYSP
jgi:hypothetical protein